MVLNAADSRTSTGVSNYGTLTSQAVAQGVQITGLNFAVGVILPTRLA